MSNLETTTELPTLPPKRSEDSETAWANVWEVTQHLREASLGAEMGRRITEEINHDPAEVVRLRTARREAREGRRAPRQRATD